MRRATQDAPPIELPLDWLERKLGRPIAPSEVRAILESLSFGVTEAAMGVFSVTVPSWRATKDVSIKDDLLEEVGRMVGYDSIAPVAPLMPVTVPPANPERTWHYDLRELAAAQGFSEVSNYSFVSEEQAREFGFDPAEQLRLLNPIAAGQDLMRVSLLPGILKNIRDNSRYFDSFRLFEIGSEIHKQAEGLPREIPHLAAAVYAKEDAGQVYELKRLAECLVQGIEVRPAAARSFEHPARTADLLLRGEIVGRLFELHPSKVEHGRAAVLDLDLAVLYRLHAPDSRYTPIRRFPSSAFDLSVVAGARELVGTIEARLRGHAGPDVERIEFVRVYEGPPLPEGKKSVSFRLTVSAPRPHPVVGRSRPIPRAPDSGNARCRLRSAGLKSPPFVWRFRRQPGNP